MESVTLSHLVVQGHLLITPHTSLKAFSFYYKELYYIYAERVASPEGDDGIVTILCHLALNDLSIRDGQNQNRCIHTENCYINKEAFY